MSSNRALRETNEMTTKRIRSKRTNDHRCDLGFVCFDQSRTREEQAGKTIRQHRIETHQEVVHETRAIDAYRSDRRSQHFDNRQELKIKLTYEIKGVDESEIDVKACTGDLLDFLMGNLTHFEEPENRTKGARVRYGTSDVQEVIHGEIQLQKVIEFVGHAVFIGRVAEFLSDVSDIIETSEITSVETRVAIFEKLFGRTSEKSLRMRTRKNRFSMKSHEKAEHAMCCRMSRAKVDSRKEKVNRTGTDSFHEGR